jgi:choline dehydrogenase-like flavoprotein
MATVVVIGAGLAGSLLASRLAATRAGHDGHRVIVIEQSSRNIPIRITDRGRPASLDTHAGAGFGGTSHFWHNGLIELEADDYARWPLPARDLQRHLPAAHEALSGAGLDLVKEIEAQLRGDFDGAGVPMRLLGRPLFYPVRRRNLWQSEEMPGRGVTKIVGRVERLQIDDGGRVRGAVLHGGAQPVNGDLFILCGGGLGSPVLLQASGVAPNAGRFYFDHPCGFVGEIAVRADLNKVWNRFDRRLHGSVRLPLVIKRQRQKFAFYLRPAGATGLKVKSVLSDLRNAPLDPRNYLRLLLRTNDLVEAVSLRAGINIPTRRFLLYMVAEQLPQEDCSIFSAGGAITRDWQLDAAFFAEANRAIEQLLADLAPIVTRATVFPDWADDLQTCAHHCGTARMADAAPDGVSDRDGRVFGTENLLVCDGSAIPAAAYANTGLTIAALALRMAETLRA